MAVRFILTDANLILLAMDDIFKQ